LINQIFQLERPLFVVDCETTGTDVQVDRIISLGIQRWEALGMTLEWKTLVDPGVPIPPESTEVHGITDAMVQGCRQCGQSGTVHAMGAAGHDFDPWPRFASLAKSIAGGFQQCDFAGKNVRFDLRIIAAEMLRAGAEWSYADARVIDAERIEQVAVPRTLSDLYRKYVRKICPECEGKGKFLDAPDKVLTGRTYWVDCETCKGVGSIGEEFDEAHDALADVKASAIVIIKQLETHSILPRTLQELHDVLWPGWIDPDGKFRFIKGVACFSNWGKYAGKPMKSAEKGYWDWILKADFPADVKRIAAEAKLGKFPEQRTNVDLR